MYSFLKAFLLLMKLLSLSQFYAPKFSKMIMLIVKYTVSLISMVVVRVKFLRRRICLSWSADGYFV